MPDLANFWHRARKHARTGKNVAIRNDRKFWQENGINLAIMLAKTKLKLKQKLA